MKQIKPYLVIATFFFLSASCNSGYNKQNGKWVWISYDEAVGVSFPKNGPFKNRIRQATQERVQ